MKQQHENTVNESRTARAAFFSTYKLVLTVARQA